MRGQNGVLEREFASVLVPRTEEIVFHVLEGARVDAGKSDRTRNAKIQNINQSAVVAWHPDLLTTVQRTRSQVVRVGSLIYIGARPAIDVHRDSCWNHGRRSAISADAVHCA